MVEYLKKQEDRTDLKRLQKMLNRKEKEEENLLDSLKQCNIDIVKNTIFEEIQKIEQEKVELRKQIMEEQGNYITVTLTQVKNFLKLIKKGSVKDLKYRKMLINVLIDKIYIYDDSITIMFNIQNKDFSAKYPNISEIESSYLGNNAQPNKTI